MTNHTMGKSHAGGVKAGLSRAAYQDPTPASMKMLPRAPAPKQAINEQTMRTYERILTLWRYVSHSCQGEMLRDSGCRESNSDYMTPSHAYYHYTTARKKSSSPRVRTIPKVYFGPTQNITEAPTLSRLVHPSGFSRASRLAVARLGLGTTSLFGLLASHRSGVRILNRIALQFWCTLQDSNLRPFECESNALTN